MKLSDVNWYLVYKKWTANAGVFEYLFKSSPFVTAKYMEDYELESSFEPNINEVLKESLRKNISENTIIIADVDTELGLNIAVNLNNEFNVSPILSYNFLFHPYGIVGNKKLLEHLIIASEFIKPIKQITYAFILDSNRYINSINLDDPMIFNNQYEITEEEMPDADALKNLKVDSAAFFYKGNIKEDITCYLEYLKTNHINVKLIDLGESL